MAPRIRIWEGLMDRVIDGQVNKATNEIDFAV